MTQSLPIPKFNVGDLVWLAYTERKQGVWPCPDCRGSKQWEAKTAAGETIAVLCPRCEGYSQTKLPSLTRQIVAISTQRRTIGSIRIDTASHDHKISYMCEETGVGTGNLYNEGSGNDRGLYGSKAEAEHAAEQMQIVLQAEIDKSPQALMAEHFAKLPLKVGLVDHLWQELYSAWSQARTLQEAIREVLDNPEVDEQVQENLEEAMKEQTWHPQNPMKALMEASEALLKHNRVLGTRDVDWDALQAAVDGVRKAAVSVE